MQLDGFLDNLFNLYTIYMVVRKFLIQRIFHTDTYVYLRVSTKLLQYLITKSIAKFNNNNIQQLLMVLIYVPLYIYINIYAPHQYWYHLLFFQVMQFSISPTENPIIHKLLYVFLFSSSQMGGCYPSAFSFLYRYFLYFLQRKNMHKYKYRLIHRIQFCFSISPS